MIYTRLFIASLLVLLCTPAFGCIWDFDTLRDEKRGLPGVAELLAGRYERHSHFFYEQRVLKMKERLAATPNDLAALDNLAAACEKLDDHDTAIATMLRKDKIKPGEYTTYANLGTFYMHKGDFEQGADYIKKALAINPDAHFGREWVQLKLAEYYIAAKADPSLLTKRDFLGADGFGEYHGRYISADRSSEDPIEIPANAMEGVIGMIRFGTGTSAELYLVLGEMLEGQAPRRRGRQQYHLACRAYLRAIELAHSRSGAIKEHLRSIRLSDLDPAGYADSTISRERSDGAAWLKAYQDYEDDLVRAGKDTENESSYAAFYAAHPRLDESYHFSDLHSWWSRKWYSKDDIILSGILVGGAVLVALKIRSDRRKRRKFSNPLAR